MNSVKKRYIKHSVIALLAVVVSIGCGGDKAPDVSNIPVKVESQRLDKDLYGLDTNNLALGLMSLEKKYPDFLGFYLDTVMGFGINRVYADTNSGIQKGLHTFLTHEDYRGVFDTVLAHYTDEKKIDDVLAKGFQYVKHYFPTYDEPEIIYLVSGLNNYGALTYGSNTLGIGLDMFLGADYPFYEAVGIPEYFSKQLNENYIPVAVFRTVYRERRPFIVEGNNLLHMMIQSGKEMYFISKVLPFLDEHTRLAYTQEQLNWCEENEAMVYDFFVREELFYEKNLQKILRYVMDGPSATGMPSQSPGNIGSWLGLQIVKAYVNQHPDMSLIEILDDETDAQSFLQQSKYKPK